MRLIKKLAGGGWVGLGIEGVVVSKFKVAINIRVSTKTIQNLTITPSLQCKVLTCYTVQILLFLKPELDNTHT